VRTSYPLTPAQATIVVFEDVSGSNFRTTEATLKYKTLPQRKDSNASSEVCFAYLSHILGENPFFAWQKNS